MAKSLHHQVCACMKQDVPEVEMVIAILTPLLEEWWLQLIDDVLRQGALIVEQGPTLRPVLRVTFSEAEENSIVAAIMMVLRRHIWAMPSDLIEAVEDGRDQLLLDALLAAGLSGTRLELLIRAGALEAGLGPLRASAVQDLSTLMAGRVESRLPEVRIAVRAWVRAARRDAAALGGAPTPTATSAAVNTLEGILGAQDAKRWIPFSVDQWGYRWFTIWNTLDDLQAGALFFQAVAVRDTRTTEFCLWVDGRLISADRVRNQIRNHIRATMQGDIAALMANWPLLGSDIVNHKGAGQDAVFGRAFAGLGLPPYHGRCRTGAASVRL